MLLGPLTRVHDGDRLQVAIRVGAREVGFTVLTISVSLVAVFIPILLVAFAYGVTALGDLSGAGWIHGVSFSPSGDFYGGH